MENDFKFTEAMQHLRVSRSTLNRFLESGQLTGYKVGHTWRFTKDALNQCKRWTPTPMSDHEMPDILLDAVG